MNHVVPYLLGVATLPALAGVSALVNHFALEKREYDCGWCNFTTRADNAHKSQVDTPVIVAETKLFIHENSRHRNIIREFKKLTKNGVEFFDAKRLAREKYPKEYHFAS